MAAENRTEKHISKNFLTNVMIVKTVKVTGKGQISIPVEIRDAAGIETGDELIVIQENSKILLEKPVRILKDEFSFMLKHSEKVAKKLWDNKKDEIWNNM